MATSLSLGTRTQPISSTVWPILPHLGLCLEILPGGLLPVIQGEDTRWGVNSLESETGTSEVLNPLSTGGAGQSSFLARCALHPFLPCYEGYWIIGTKLPGSLAGLGLARRGH